MGRRALAAALLAATVLTACGGAETPTFGEDDTAIAVEVGERFRIALRASPGVGDDWRVVGPPNAAVATLVGEDYEGDDPEPEPGSGGETRFTFEATGPGTAEIRIFNCFRCGASDVPAPEDEMFAQTVAFEVTVR